jgi:hypothetical protein
MPWTHRDFWLLPLFIGAILGLFIWIVEKSRLREVYREQFRDSRRERIFLASFGFFTAVLVVRGITIAIHNDIGPFHDVSLGGRHVHHLVWGILLLLLVGYLWLVQCDSGKHATARWLGGLTSILYGVAAALTLDEFALWLNLRDVYWAREGRESYEAMALFGGLLSLGFFGAPFFRGVVKEAGKAGRRKR